MSLLSNIRHILRCTKPHAMTAEKKVSQTFIAWPFIDNLFDFTKIIGKGNALTSVPIENGLNKKVAIIGAGAGGMSAAYELLKCGVVADVYEASDRVGGRAWSKNFTNEDGKEVSAFAELGSMRVPPSQKTFWAYANGLI
jgi:tryptophan 2-monooxygenase